MTVYQSSERLTENLRALFEQIHARDGAATRAIADARLVIRIRTHTPATEITIDGRKTPVTVSYTTTRFHPDLDIELSADVLHAVLMGEQSMKTAFTRGLLKVKGPFWKAFALEGIFRQGQRLYPQIFTAGAS